MSDIKNQALFSVELEDGNIFEGGISYYDTKWKQIPDKKIIELNYRLPDGNHLNLSGYDEYFHMVEATMDLNGPKRGQTKIEYAYIMGKKEDKVTSYRITMLHKKNDRYKIGDIVRREFNIEDKFIQGLNKSYWR